MNLVRYEHGGSIHHGVVEGDQIAEIEGDFFGERRPSGVTTPLSAVTLKSPTVPSKILNIAGNYLSHMGEEPPFTRPQPFLAPPSSVLDPGATILIPSGSTDVHYEGEMAVVIGRRCSKVSEAEAGDYVLGVCPANDVSERDWQNGDDKDVQWWRAKGADTFSPFGPWVTTGLDYANLHLVTRVNGEVVQDTNTSDLIFGVDTLVSFISQSMTLEPGDAIFTGTSGETEPIKAGDVVDVELEGSGVLSNPVADEG
jgi:2-keto-4-pentenoate hydratase/2-oxohepta-3-ene-1,7-dioic acid hydratase in catechol pathway